LETVAQVLYERAKELRNDDAKEVMKRRNEALKFRYSMKQQLRESGVQPGDEDYKLFTQTSIDEIMYQLLDPEAVLEEEGMMKRGLVQVNGYKEVEAKDTAPETEVRYEHVDMGTRGEDSAESLLKFNERRWASDLEQLPAFRSASRDLSDAH
jgi:hypothetical protein